MLPWHLCSSLSSRKYISSASHLPFTPWTSQTARTTFLKASAMCRFITLHRSTHNVLHLCSHFLKHLFFISFFLPWWETKLWWFFSAFRDTDMFTAAPTSAKDLQHQCQWGQEGSTWIPLYIYRKNAKLSYLKKWDCFSTSFWSLLPHQLYFQLWKRNLISWVNIYENKFLKIINYFGISDKSFTFLYLHYYWEA